MKFLNVFQRYNHAKQDLKQVNKLSELINLTTLKMIGNAWVRHGCLSCPYLAATGRRMQNKDLSAWMR